MGKASRRKLDNSPGTPVRRLVKDLGLHTGSRDTVWANVQANLGEIEIASIGDLFARIESTQELPPDTYRVLWQSEKSAQVTWPHFHGLTVRVLEHLHSIKPGDRVVDVGAGIGVHACFIARQHPRTEVVAVEPDESACEIARGFAIRLGLRNLTVIQAGVEDLTQELIGGPVNTLLCSLVLVAATELSELPAADVWSISRSMRAALTETPAEAVRRLASVLVDDGQYIGLERTPDALVLARWLGWLQGAGIGPAGIKTLVAGDERVPLVVGRRGSSSCDLQDLVREHAIAEVTVEDQLEADPPEHRLAGLHLRVEDAGGDGETRIEALVLKSGTPVVVSFTTRGSRTLDAYNTAADAVEHLDQWRAAGAQDPSVVSLDELAPGPLRQSPFALLSDTSS